MTSTDIPALPISRDQSLSSQKQPLDAKELELIPQISGTCWFNAALTVILYSQMTRKVFHTEALKWLSNLEELKKNKFKRFLLFMLKYNYTEPKKIAELFRGRIKPEFLLFSYLKNTDNQVGIKKTKMNLYSPFSGISIENIPSNTNVEFYDILENLILKKYDVVKFYYKEGNSYISNSYSLSPQSFSSENFSAKVVLFYHDKFEYVGFFNSESINGSLQKINEYVKGVVAAGSVTVAVAVP